MAVPKSSINLSRLIQDQTYGLDQTFKDYLAANEAVKMAVYKYNNKRPHANCDYMTPVEAHAYKGKLKKRWRKKEPKSVDNFIEMQR